MTAEGLRAGVVQTVPIMIASSVFGAAFGMFAAQANLPEPVAILMSVIVCAGTAQFGVTSLWNDPLPWAAMLTAALAVNLRFLLLGAALREKFRTVSPGRAYLSLFFLYDGNWALLMRRYGEGRSDAGFLLASGLMMYVSWQVATVAGFHLGRMIENPARFGLDFIIAAFLTNLAAGFWKSRSDLLPLAAAALVSVLCRHFVSTELNIVAGAVAGSLAALLRKPNDA
jgi:4-azaleucine resistance transporter AzlC